MTGARRFAVAALDALPASPPTPAPEELPAPPAGRIVNLSLNEGADGPFPAALDAIARVASSLNRYPSRGSARLTRALADRLGVTVDELVVTAGGDSVIGYLAQSGLEPGDEVVVPWPSFPSFVRDAQKRGATPRLVDLREGAIDLEAVRGAVTPRTRLVFLASPNNPTGLPLDPPALRAFVDALPERVLPVIDEAYFEYLEPEAGDAVADLLLTGRRVVVIRTFSKLYGLAGLRVGYGVGPSDVVDAIRRVQRGYDVNAVAQAAALASLEDRTEVLRRRAANREAVATLLAILRSAGLEPLEGTAANFVLVDVGMDADAFTARLFEHGIVVQSGRPYGAPTAVRISTGPREDLETLAAGLAAVAPPPR